MSPQPGCVIDPLLQVSNMIKRAIIIDDDELMAMTLGNLLDDFNIKSELVSNAYELRKVIETFDPQLILLDIRLKTSDAYAILRAHIDPSFNGIVSIVSGCGIESLLDLTLLGEKRGFKMGPPLPKPFNRTDLEDIVELANELFERVRLSKEAKERAHNAAIDCDLKLQQAIKENRLELWYQPKLDLKTGTPAGAEALIRGRLPDGGIVMPHQLFAGASQQDFTKLTEFVIRQSIADTDILRDTEFSGRISVNIPMSFLRQCDPASLIRDAAMSPKWAGLIFEITEDEALSNNADVRDAVMQLALYEVDISIDDFGAGYSSLARLRDLPFKELKLDQGFVQGCASDSMKYSICKNVLALGTELGCTTVAEGVDNAEDLRACIELGCDIVQGYHYSVPLTLSDLIKFIKSAHTLSWLPSSQSEDH